MTQKARNVSEMESGADAAFEEILALIDRTVEELLERRDFPEEIRRGRATIHRFTEKDSRTAILLKLALVASNLRAGRLLIDHGFLYEWTMVRRLLCETIEDVMLLIGGALAEPGCNLHERFLAAFYSEEVDDHGNMNEEHVWAPKRREIRSFLDYAEKRLTGENVRQGEDFESATGAMYRLDSGHIHGKASSIMRLYDGKERKFCTDGAIGEEFAALELQTLWLTTCAVLRCIASARDQAFGWPSGSDALRMAGEFARIAR